MYRTRVQNWTSFAIFYDAAAAVTILIDSLIKDSGMSLRDQLCGSEIE